MDKKILKALEYCLMNANCYGCPVRDESNKTGNCECRTKVLQFIAKNIYDSETSSSETANHPEHYQGKHECIDEMIALFGVEAVKAFCKCNVYKYRYRADRKNGTEDLHKADWYMDKLMELEKEND